MSKRKKRRYRSPEQKVSILREHLIERRPVSDVCEAHDLQPSVFYDWQRKFFENGAAAFTTDRDAEKRRLEKRVSQLESKLAHKDHVIARVTEEFVKAKKADGEP
jgi:transposase